MKRQQKTLFISKATGDWLGFAFFSAISIYSAVKGIQEESLWLWLPVLHNGIIAVLFLMRRPSTKEDGVGLVMAILAIFCPTSSVGVPLSGIWGILGVFGLVLIFWAIGALGRSFGLAPADRGLVTGGPYRIIRHPMYLGELIYQAAALGMKPGLVQLGLFLILVFLQAARIIREEQIIEDYQGYKRKVCWRLLIGIW